MHALELIGIHGFGLYLFSALMLSMLPGPATMYIVGRSMSEGRRAGLLSVLGIETGSAFHVVAVAFGLSALLAASQTAFLVLKTLGAAYLIYLGIGLLWKARPGREGADLSQGDPGDDSPSGRAAAVAAAADGSAGRRAYVQGAVTQILNPKASLFFLAILPQFVILSARHSALPFLVLGAAFMVIDAAWFSIVALSSAGLTAILRRSQRVQRLLEMGTGLLYVGLGIGLLRARARMAH